MSQWTTDLRENIGCRSFEVHLYRVTLCVTLCGTSGRLVSVCLSVCPSRVLCCVLYLKTAKYIVKLLSRPGSLVLLVFLGQASLPNSKGTPSVGELNRGWVGKIRDFRPMSRFEMVQYGCYRALIGSYTDSRVYCLSSDELAGERCLHIRLIQ